MIKCYNPNQREARPVLHNQDLDLKHDKKEATIR